MGDCAKPGVMVEPLDVVKDRLARAQARVGRAQKALESAKTEQAELEITLRIMSEISGESVGLSGPQSSISVTRRQGEIVDILKAGRENALAPAELYDRYNLMATENISIDTFRTTIWRMKDTSFVRGDDLWLVKGDGGRYWKEAGTFNTRARMTQTASHTEVPDEFDTDLDDDPDPPF